MFAYFVLLSVSFFPFIQTARPLLNLFAYNKCGRMHRSDAEAGVTPLFQKKIRQIHTMAVH